jgi:hypothetical protein
MNDRINTILGHLGLLDRVFDGDLSKNEKPMDYARVQKVMIEDIKNSSNTLKYKIM